MKTSTRTLLSIYSASNLRQLLITADAKYLT